MGQCLDAGSTVAYTAGCSSLVLTFISTIVCAKCMRRLGPDDTKTSLILFVDMIFGAICCMVLVSLISIFAYKREQNALLFRWPWGHLILIGWILLATIILTCATIRETRGLRSLHGPNSKGNFTGLFRGWISLWALSAGCQVTFYALLLCLNRPVRQEQTGTFSISCSGLDQRSPSALENLRLQKAVHFHGKESGSTRDVDSTHSSNERHDPFEQWEVDCKIPETLSSLQGPMSHPSKVRSPASENHILFWPDTPPPITPPTLGVSAAAPQTTGRIISMQTLPRIRDNGSTCLSRPLSRSRFPLENNIIRGQDEKDAENERDVHESFSGQSIPPFVLQAGLRRSLLDYENRTTTGHQIYHMCYTPHFIKQKSNILPIVCCIHPV
ncbi:hypothetical protein BDBG_03991 [Blastomyces gilchristii SLH14081]|uniref:Uncharacterized protein n=1 Tax=Blastomyces gilchristii (strain SLH14081) TaxID=559298 RepID=A0A179UNJ8_BLAGS|nr:uncharacterized protein BDBG_03991 [Blastomyces gilchristii SLH14081]OAT07992.1 hypothetical protein BDBG_03991 [Blastomyces gilchristii SLH14081]